MFGAAFSFCALLQLLFSEPRPTYQFRVDAFTSTWPTAGVPRANPCFSEPDSSACLVFVAHRRTVSLAAARALAARARALYASQETSPDALYDRAAVAVACLASAGTMRPGPDSDCAACGPACGAESRADVCALYCAPPPPATALSTQSVATGSPERSGNRGVSLENESNTPLDRNLLVLVIFPCVCFVVLSSLLALLLAITCRRQSSRKCQRIGGTDNVSCGIDLSHDQQVTALKVDGHVASHPHDDAASWLHVFGEQTADGECYSHVTQYSSQKEDALK